MDEKLSIEALYLEDDIGINGTFLVEHGVSEGLLGYGADFSGDSERCLMNGIEGHLVKDRLSSACQFEVMSDIAFALIGAERGHMVSHGDALIEWFHDGEVHDPSEIGLTGEDQDEGVIRVHFKVGQEPEFFQRSGLEEMGLIDDEDYGFSHLLFGFEQGLLDLAVDGAFGQSVRESEEPVEVIEEIGPAQGGQGGIMGGEEIFIQAVDETSQGEGFSHPGIAR